nr:MAG TPA: hypothetical protein [Caudoviricetes sp.]
MLDARLNPIRIKGLKPRLSRLKQNIPLWLPTDSHLFTRRES